VPAGSRRRDAAGGRQAIAASIDAPLGRKQEQVKQADRTGMQLKTNEGIKMQRLWDLPFHFQ